MKLMPALAAILLLALSISAHQASDHPFGNLSERAGHVVLRRYSKPSSGARIVSM